MTDSLPLTILFPKKKSIVIVAVFVDNDLTRHWHKQPLVIRLVLKRKELKRKKTHPSIVCVCLRRRRWRSSLQIWHLISVDCRAPPCALQWRQEHNSYFFCQIDADLYQRNVCHPNWQTTAFDSVITLHLVIQSSLMREEALHNDVSKVDPFFFSF